jgi:RNA polymerase sigma-70 factor, ECF subfamily
MGENEAKRESIQVDAFVQLLGQHQLRLFRYVFAMVPRVQDAEDVMQEVSRALWQRFGEFQPGTNFLAWAQRVAYFRVLEFRRSSDRRLRILPEDLLQAVAERTNISDEVEDGRTAALACCFKELRPEDQALITARYTPGITIADLASRIGRPANSVYKSLGRIRQTLLTCIERRIGTVS